MQVQFLLLLFLVCVSISGCSDSMPFPGDHHTTWHADLHDSLDATPQYYTVFALLFCQSLRLQHHFYLASPLCLRLKHNKAQELWLRHVPVQTSSWQQGLSLYQQDFRLVTEGLVYHWFPHVLLCLMLVIVVVVMEVEQRGETWGGEEEGARKRVW